MHGPLARTTPTRWPWHWTLLLMWLVLTAWSPAFAADEAAVQPAPAGAGRCANP